MSLNLGSRKAKKRRRRINAQVNKVLRTKKDQSKDDGSRRTCAISTKDCRLVQVYAVVLHRKVDVILLIYHLIIFNDMT